MVKSLADDLVIFAMMFLGLNSPSLILAAPNQHGVDWTAAMDMRRNWVCTDGHDLQDYMHARSLSGKKGQLSRWQMARAKLTAHFWIYFEAEVSSVYWEPLMINLISMCSSSLTSLPTPATSESSEPKPAEPRPFGES